MRRNYRLAGYLLAAALLVAFAVSGPHAWATPDQTPADQTVPTRTPKPSTPRPTDQPPPATPIPSTATAQPPAPIATNTLQATASPLPQTSTPTSTPAVPTSTPTAGGTALDLTIRANPPQVWAGQPVEYTLSLVNRSASSIRNVVLLDPLSTDLEPGAVISGVGASWQDRTLRVEKGELAPGEQLEIVFQAIVGANLPPGTAIVNQASASTAGGLEASASVTIALPPPELPRVGGVAHGAR